MKAQVGAFNQEKALVGAFSVIVQLHRLIVYSTHLIVVHPDVLLPVGAVTPVVPAQAGEQLLEAGHDVVACAMGRWKIFFVRVTPNVVFQLVS